MHRILFLIAILSPALYAAGPGDRFAVIGVISAADGVVVIKDKQQNRNLVLRDGDALANSGYRIVEVGRKEVTIARGSQKYLLVKDAFEQPAGGYAKAPRRSLRKMKKPVRKDRALDEDFEAQAYGGGPGSRNYGGGSSGEFRDDFQGTEAYIEPPPEDHVPIIE